MPKYIRSTLMMTTLVSLLSGCQVVSVKNQSLNITITNERESILTRDKLSEASLNVLSMTGREAKICAEPRHMVSSLSPIVSERLCKVCDLSFNLLYTIMSSRLPPLSKHLNFWWLTWVMQKESLDRNFTTSSILFMRLLLFVKTNPMSWRWMTGSLKEWKVSHAELSYRQIWSQNWGQSH